MSEEKTKIRVIKKSQTPAQSAPVQSAQQSAASSNPEKKVVVIKKKIVTVKAKVKDEKKEETAAAAPVQQRAGKTRGQEHPCAAFCVTSDQAGFFKR